MKSFFSSSLCLFLLFGTASYAYSQSQHELSNYNLPPGYRLNPKQEIHDLSQKLDGNFLEIKEPELKVLQQITKEELKDTSPEYQQYIKVGEALINSLSDKVKKIYTEDELWYIYAFDKELINRLQKL